VKRLVTLLLALAVVGSLIGCRRPPPPKPASVTPPETPTAKPLPSQKAVSSKNCLPPVKPSDGWKAYRVAATILTRKHPFYKDLSSALEDTARKYNVELDIQSSEMNPSVQRDQVQDFIVQQVDAIIVCPADSAAIGGAIRSANQAGVPVFTADIAADAGDVVCHIASDNVQGGRLAGEYMAQALKDQGKIIIIDHPSVTSVQDRVRGFEQALAGHPQIEILDKPAANGLREKAYERTSNALLAHPDLDGIFGINDDSALGALAALRNADKEGLIVVGYDATAEARKEILAGSPLKADVIQYPEDIGRLTIETIVKYLNGEQVPSRIDVQVGIVDRAALQAQQQAGGGE